MNPGQDGGRTGWPATAAVSRRAALLGGVAMTALLFGDRRSGIHAMIGTASGAATPAATETLAGLLGHLVGDDSEFTGQFLRALDVIVSGGADIGECFVTAQATVPGDHERWLTA